MKNTFVAVLVVGLGLVGLSAGLIGQTPAPSYVPSEEQAKDLRLAVRDAQYKQSLLNAATNDFQTSISTLQAKIKEVETENKWPSTVTYTVDPNTANVTFTNVPAPAAPPVKN